VVSVATLGTASEPPRAAFAVGRNVGGAVVRNRVRRRLRSALVEHHDLLRPGCGYLVIADAAAADATYGELDGWVSAALRAHSHGARR